MLQVAISLAIVGPIPNKKKNCAGRTYLLFYLWVYGSFSVHWKVRKAMNTDCYQEHQIMFVTIDGKVFPKRT